MNTFWVLTLINCSKPVVLCWGVASENAMAKILQKTHNYVEWLCKQSL